MTALFPTSGQNSAAMRVDAVGHASIVAKTALGDARRDVRHLCGTFKSSQSKFKQLSVTSHMSRSRHGESRVCHVSHVARHKSSCMICDCIMRHASTRASTQCGGRVLRRCLPSPFCHCLGAGDAASREPIAWPITLAQAGCNAFNCAATRILLLVFPFPHQRQQAP